MTLLLKDGPVALNFSHHEILESLRDRKRLIAACIAPGDNEDTSEINVNEFIAYFDRILRKHSKESCIIRARDAVSDLVLPDNLDDSPLLQNSSFEDIVRLRQALNNKDMYNADRCHKMFDVIDDTRLPEAKKKILREIAHPGSRYMISPSFVVDSTVKDTSNLLKELGNTGLFHAIKLWKQNKCVMFNLNNLPSGFLSVHGFDLKVMAHWTVKDNCDEGRFLLNFGKSVGCLNDDESKLLSNDRYGDLSCPSIKDFVTDLYHYCRVNNFVLNDIRFYVLDNKGAYNCHQKDAAFCKYCAVRVSRDFLMIPIYGSFGSHDEPDIYDAPATATDIRIRERIHGVLMRYVDDRTGGAHFSYAEADKDVVKETNYAVYGPQAFDDKKEQAVGVQAITIGYVINSETDVLRVNDKGIEKQIILFNSISTSHKVKWTIPQVQAMASVAERCSIVTRGSRPFVTAFNALLRGLPQSEDQRRFYLISHSAEARFAVQFWRAVGLTNYANPNSLAVPVFSIVDKHFLDVDYRPITDAFSHIGMLLRDADYNIISWSSFELPFVDTDNRQNAKEFLGIIVTILTLYLDVGALSGTVISMTMDSTTALSYIRKNKSSSKYCQYSFTIYTWLIVKTGYIINEYVHTAGAGPEMSVCDNLSRDIIPESILGFKQVDLSSFPGVTDLLRLCSPSLLKEQTKPILEVFEEITVLLNQILLR